MRYVSRGKFGRLPPIVPAPYGHGHHTDSWNVYLEGFAHGLVCCTEVGRSALQEDAVVVSTQDAEARSLVSNIMPAPQAPQGDAGNVRYDAVDFVSKGGA